MEKKKKTVIIAAMACIVIATTTLILLKSDSEKTECDLCEDYTGQDFKGIPVKLAYKMVELYKTDHWDGYTIKENPDAKDARSVWFSLDTLKKFIWYIENEVCQKKCVDPSTLGLRFYYGEYPGKDEWADLDGEKSPEDMIHKAEYQGLHTVLILPTYYSKSSGFNVDFDPRKITSIDGKCMPMPLQDVFNELDGGSDSLDQNQNARTLNKSAVILSPDVSTTIRNKGSLIPPPPPPSSASRAGEKNGAVIFDTLEKVRYTYGY